MTPAPILRPHGRPIRDRLLALLGSHRPGDASRARERAIAFGRELWAWIRDIPGLPAVAAGLAGGSAMAAYEMLAAWTLGMGALAPLRMIGAAHPGGDPLLSGTILHLVTAGFWGIQLGHVLGGAPPSMWRPHAAVVLGLLWGAALWLLMGIVIGPLFNPLMVDVHPVHYFVGHLVYGLVSVVSLSQHLGRRTR